MDAYKNVDLLYEPLHDSRAITVYADASSIGNRLELNKLFFYNMIAVVVLIIASEAVDGLFQHTHIAFLATKSSSAYLT